MRKREIGQTKLRGFATSAVEANTRGERREEEREKKTDPRGKLRKNRKVLYKYMIDSVVLYFHIVSTIQHGDREIFGAIRAGLVMCFSPLRSLT